MRALDYCVQGSTQQQVAQDPLSFSLDKQGEWKYEEKREEDN
jgi:hypothetical protein